MADEPTRAGLPPHLAKAAPGAPDAAARPAVTTAAKSSRPVASAPVRPGEPMFPCPCACGCGNLTSMPERMAAKHSSSRFLRCDPCALKGGEHAATGPTKSDVAAASAAIKPLVAVVNPIDAELDALADAEQDRLNFEKDWAKWQESLPEKFRRAWLDKQVDADNAAAIRERLELLKQGKPAGAILSGPIGGGKSWLAYAYANHAVHARLLRSGEIRHGTEVELLGNIAVAQWNERAQLLKALLSPRLKMLIIDDVGREMRTRPADRKALYDEIANLAWANGRALVLTTNLLPGTPPDPDDEAYLAGWVGAAAYSRISTSAGSSTISVADRQMRRKLWEAEQAQRGQGPATGGASPR